MKNGTDRNIPWLTAEYFTNRQKFPPEELAKYAGKHIAWGLDGKTILASGDTLDELEEQLAARGIPSEQAVRSYVDEPGVSFAAGFWDAN